MKLVVKLSQTRTFFLPPAWVGLLSSPRGRGIQLPLVTSQRAFFSRCSEMLKRKMEFFISGHVADANGHAALLENTGSFEFRTAGGL